MKTEERHDAMDDTRACVLFVLAFLLLGMTILPGLAQGPSRTLLRHADLVITMEPQLGEGALGLIPNGDVLMEGDRIAAVGQGLDGTGASIIDATGKIILPGFVDVHNHLWQSLIRGCGTSLAVGEWLQTCVFPVGRLNVTAQEAYAVVRLSTLDLLAAGGTARPHRAASLDVPCVSPAPVPWSGLSPTPGLAASAPTTVPPPGCRNQR